MQLHPVSLEVVRGSDGKLVLVVPQAVEQLLGLHAGDKLAVRLDTLEKLVPVPPLPPGLAKGIRTPVTKVMLKWHYYPVPTVVRGDLFPPDGKPFVLTDGKVEWRSMWVKSLKITGMAPAYARLQVKEGDVVEIQELDRWSKYGIKVVPGKVP